MFKKILLFVFCFSLLLAAPQTFAADVLDLVPGNADLIIRTNIKQIIHIPEIKKHVQELFNENKSEYAKQVKATGFNILTDIESAVMFLQLGSANPQNPLKTDIAIIVTGKFNIEKTIEALKTNKEVTDKLVISQEDGFQTITNIDEEKGNTKVLYLDPSTVIAGSETGVNNAKLVKLGKLAGIRTNKDFASVVAKLNPAATAAASVILPNNVRDFFAGNEKSKPLSSIQYLSLDLTKKDNLDINVIGDFSATANMKEVESSLKSFFSSVKPEELPYEAFSAIFKQYQLSFTASSVIS